MIRRPPRSTQSRSSAASDVYKRQSYAPCQGQAQSHGPCPPCQGQGLHPCHRHANCILCCLRRLANNSMCQSQGLRHCHHCLRIGPASHSCRPGQTNCLTPRFPAAHNHSIHCAATSTWLDHRIHNACSLAPVKMACAQSCTGLCCLCSIPLSDGLPLIVFV